MSMICVDHKVSCVWKEGVSKAGKGYAFWACPEKDSEGNYCKAEKIDDEQSPAASIAEQARVKAASVPSFNGNGKDPHTSHRIERMHSQEMGLRYAAIIGGKETSLEQIDEYTEHFLEDLEN